MAGTNEQFTEAFLKYVYAPIKEIYITQMSKTTFKSAIKTCFRNTISNTIDMSPDEYQRFLDTCKNYSILSSFQNLYLLPTTIKYIHVMLIVTTIILALILISLIIMFIYFYK